MKLSNEISQKSDLAQPTIVSLSGTPKSKVLYSSEQHSRC